MAAATVVISRPEHADDYVAWEKYHVAQADAIGRQPPAADLLTRIGQLQGEVDHRVEAIGYAELAAKQGAGNSKETVMAEENVSRELKPVRQLSDREIVLESRDSGVDGGSPRYEIATGFGHNSAPLSQPDRDRDHSTKEEMTQQTDFGIGY